MPEVFAYIAHKDGVADDTAAELAAAAKKIDAAHPPIAVVTGSESDAASVCEAMRGFYSEVWKIVHEPPAHPDAELLRQVLAAVLPRGAVLLVPHNHFGVDLSPGLSIRMNAAFVPDVLEIQGVEGAILKLVRQEFGGQVSAHVRCDISVGAVLNIRPGAFQPLESGAAAGVVVDKPVALGASAARRRLLSTVPAEAGDVDITREPVLVSVGRGIQEQDNIHLAEELAEAMGAAVSCSRPVVDARWMDKSRQVGSSGKTVKPKVYLACGISGSFQHLAGIKGNPLLVAINKNPKAPIFRVADVGVVADLVEFLPELTARIREK